MRLLLYILGFLMVPCWGEDRTGSFTRVPSEKLRGVDVSHHQQWIDWDRVAEHEAIDFAFVKATEGGDFSDSLFCRNWEELRRLGIRRGAYHFFRSYGCGYEQAMHFLRTVELEAGDLAPVLDLETTDGMPTEIMLEEVGIWLRLVEGRLGVKPIIYTNQKFYERHLAGLFEEYPLWIARYSDEFPELSAGRLWDFWQYSNKGCVEGISKKVDLNVFPGNTDMLDRLCWFPEIDLEEVAP
jgi:lysozyme